MSYSSLIFPLWKNTAADVCQYLNTKDASKKIHLANSLATQQWHMWDFCWLSIIETQTVQSWMSENLCPSRCTNWWIGTHMYYSWVLLFHIILRYLDNFFSKHIHFFRGTTISHFINYGFLPAFSMTQISEEYFFHTKEAYIFHNGNVL